MPPLVRPTTGHVFHEFPYDRTAATRAYERIKRAFHNEVMGEFTPQPAGPYTLPPVDDSSNQSRYTRRFESPYRNRAEFILRVARADDIDGRPPVPTLKIVIGRELNPPVAPYETPPITPEKAMERDAKAIASGLRQHLPGGTYDRVLIELMRQRASALHVARDGFSEDEIRWLRVLRGELTESLRNGDLEARETAAAQLQALNKLLDHAGFAP
jgi:hypothetical protein